MVHFGKFVHSDSGRKIMSILLGFGLASLFRRVCKGKECVLFYAPPLENIENKIFKNGDKCYTYIAKSTKCDKNKKIISFA
jgi:hypothetical protein